MSEHHRVAGGWGTASPGSREDGSSGPAWWPTGLNAEQQQQQQQQAAAAQQQQQAQQQAQQQQAQQNLHQHLLNQQQQQLSQHHQDIVRSTAAATQQLFSYKMASSFQNPATTGAQSSPVSTSSPVGSCMRGPTTGGYDYRLGVGTPGTGGGPTGAPPGVQWWYPGGVMDAGQNNLHQQQMQQQGQHLSPITSQTSTPPVMSPVRYRTRKK